MPAVQALPCSPFPSPRIRGTQWGGSQKQEPRSSRDVYREDTHPKPLWPQAGGAGSLDPSMLLEQKQNEFFQSPKASEPSHRHTHNHTHEDEGFRGLASLDFADEQRSLRDDAEAMGHRASSYWVLPVWQALAWGLLFLIQEEHSNPALFPLDHPSLPKCPLEDDLAMLPQMHVSCPRFLLRDVPCKTPQALAWGPEAGAVGRGSAVVGRLESRAGLCAYGRVGVAGGPRRTPQSQVFRLKWVLSRLRVQLEKSTRLRGCSKNKPTRCVGAPRKSRVCIATPPGDGGADGCFPRARSLPVVLLLPLPDASSSPGKACLVLWVSLSSSRHVRPTPCAWMAPPPPRALGS